MGSISSELSLDLRSSFVPANIGDFLGDVYSIGSETERASMVDDFVKRLEEEMRKIDAFKRELPLCMLLLNDAIVYLMKESTKLESSRKVKPVLEEFIPLKRNADCEAEEDKVEGLTCNNENDKDCRDKKSWLSSVQLWNANDDQTKPTANAKMNERRRYPFGNVVGGFPVARKDELSAHGLSSLLALSGIKNPKEESVYNGSGVNPSRAVGGSPSSSRAGLTAQQQAARKQRRCWSPELHRRFLNALQHLGGPQVATPKQIRELMQVDGLTNDEVKSHLQKYRLHTRRVTPGSATTTENSAVVLGDLWMNHDQCGDSSKACSSLSRSPQGPFQLGANGGSRSPTTGGESMEEDDSDAKSEGYSWKKSCSQSREI